MIYKIIMGVSELTCLSSVVTVGTYKGLTIHFDYVLYYEPRM